MSEELKPCPLCGGGETQVKDTDMWTGQRSVVISARVVHWCPRKEGQPQSNIQIAGKTREDAIAAWNTRPAPSADEVEAVQVLDLLRTGKDGRKFDCIESRAGALVNVARFFGEAT